MEQNLFTVLFSLLQVDELIWETHTDFPFYINFSDYSAD